jgi:transaldolase
MRFFLDTANLGEIRQGVAWGLCDGVTTNPTLVAKEGREHKTQILEIARVVSGPISVETTSNDTEEMVRQGLDFAGWAPNVVIKVPMTPAGLQACRRLRERSIPVNVTLAFSANQTLLASKAGATFVSPFVGRLDDIGHDGMQVVRDAVAIVRQYGFSTQVLASSLRHPLHVTAAALAGAHAATMPFKVLEQLFRHALTDLGQERFLADAARLQTELEKQKARV